MWYYFDNQWVKNPCIAPQDRAFQYGDGIFETIILRGGRALFAADHYARLQAGAEALGLDLPAYLPAKASGFAAWLAERGAEWQRLSGVAAPCLRLKIMLWRREGGLYGATHADAHCMLGVRVQERLHDGEAIRVTLYDAYRLHVHPLAGVKRLAALPYVLAARHAQQTGFDDALLLDMEGHVAEATSSNLFWAVGDVFYTPALHTGCVAGIMRLQWLRYLHAQGIECRQVRLQPAQLMAQAEGCWLVNVTGVRSIQEIEGYKIPQGSEKQSFVKAMQKAIWQKNTESR